MAVEGDQNEKVMSDSITESSKIMAIVNEIIYSPINLALVLIIAFLIYKIIRDRFEVPHAGSDKAAEPELPPLRRDFTVQELRAFDGTRPDGRVLVAANGSVFDMTRRKDLYGPGGPYSTYAGRDASRNLAQFTVNMKNDNTEYDDLSDLTPHEMDSLREWEIQFKEKYPRVGKLLRNTEQPTNYEDEKDDVSTDNKNNENITNVNTNYEEEEHDVSTDNKNNENITNVNANYEAEKHDVSIDNKNHENITNVNANSGQNADTLRNRTPKTESSTTETNETK